MANTNPPCPVCNGKTNKHDTTAAGSQRYRCTVCGKRFTPKGEKKGRKVSGNAVSGKERSRKWYARLSDAEKAKRNKAINEARRRRKEGP